MSDYQLWHLVYRYETPGDFPKNPASDSYLLVAKSEEEARTKADILFRHESEFKRDVLAQGAVRRSISPYSQSLPAPKLSIPSESSVFTLVPRIETEDLNI